MSSGPYVYEKLAQLQEQDRNVSHAQGLYWLLGTSVREIGQLCTMKEAFLSKHVRCAYNQHGPFCVCAPTMRPFSQRRGSICAVCFPRSSNASLSASMRFKNRFCGG